jgi:hypothetical protein
MHLQVVEMQTRVDIEDCRGLLFLLSSLCLTTAVRLSGLTASVSSLSFTIDDNDGGGLGFLVEGITNFSADD